MGIDTGTLTTAALPSPPAPASTGERLLRGLERRLPPAAALLLDASRVGAAASQELRGPWPLPWRRRLRAWRRGFCGISWILADFESADPRDSVNDVESVLAARVNGSWRHLLNDKLLFARLLDRFPGVVPPIYAVVRDGRFEPGPDPDSALGLEDLAARLVADGAAVIKPAGSSRGHGVYFLEHDGREFRLDGRPCPRPALARRLAVPGCVLVQQHARQHPYAAALFPETTNTLRVITMWDERADAPFVAAASQRIGTRASYPVDNVSKGGLWRFLALPDGGLGPAYGLDRAAGRRVALTAHPDTGAPLVGGAVPGFPAVLERLLAIAGALPMLPYVGWDLVITDDGFRILEGNNAPELAAMGPLLRDERVRRFLRSHGVLPPWRARCRQGP